MDIQQLYDEVMRKREQTWDYACDDSKPDYPLYTHGTFLRKMNGIWQSEIKPSGEVPSNCEITIPGYVSLQKVLLAFGSGHGDMTLIIDGEQLDPDRMEFSEKFEHEIHRGPIAKETILCAKVHDEEMAQEIYRITNEAFPVLSSDYKLI
ncbi:hypothetical protein ACFL96_15595 [Thermoproteota archaeon]